MKSKDPTKILVVDDQPINIKLLQRKLEREGYAVSTALNGVECIESVHEDKPDLILLDVMMPEMDGIEACRRLKAEESTADIPIIFITAKSSREGKLQGLEVGAVDYITKPIDLEETMARIKTNLRFQSIYRENMELQSRLGESRRAAAVGAISSGIAHNLNNLLGVVVGYLDLLKSGCDSPDMVKRSVGLMDQAINRMVNIIRQLSTITSHEKVQIQSLSLQKLLESSIERFLSEYNVEAEVEINNELDPTLTLPTNAEVIESVIGRLLMNAWESYPKKTPPEDRPITIETDLVARDPDDCVVIRIHDHGRGIDPTIRDTIFEPFITTRTSVGSGLGLTMARHAMRGMKGDIELKDRPGGGSTADIYCPLNLAPPPIKPRAPVTTATL